MAERQRRHVFCQPAWRSKGRRRLRASLHPPLHNTLPIFVQAMQNCNPSYQVQLQPLQRQEELAEAPTALGSRAGPPAPTGIHLAAWVRALVDTLGERGTPGAAMMASGSPALVLTHPGPATLLLTPRRRKVPGRLLRQPQQRLGAAQLNIKYRAGQGTGGEGQHAVWPATIMGLAACKHARGEEN